MSTSIYGYATPESPEPQFSATCADEHAGQVMAAAIASQPHLSCWTSTSEDEDEDDAEGSDDD